MRPTNPFAAQVLRTVLVGVALLSACSGGASAPPSDAVGDQDAASQSDLAGRQDQSPAEVDTHVLADSALVADGAEVHPNDVGPTEIADGANGDLDKADSPEFIPDDIGIDTPDGCDPLEPLKLEIQSYWATPVASYVPVSLGTGASLMHFDTAAGFSILYLPEGTPWTTAVGEVGVGCDTLTLDGWGVVDPGFGTSLPVVGTLGGDWLLSKPTTVDFVSGLVWRNASLPPDMGDDVPHQMVKDTIVLTVTIEGTERLLLLDTGAAYTLLNGEEPQPGDTPANFFDWNGNEVEAFLGTADLGIAGQAGKVPVLRVKSFVGIDYAAENTGLPIAGLLGLSSLSALHMDPTVPQLRIRARFLP